MLWVLWVFRCLGLLDKAETRLGLCGGSANEDLVFFSMGHKLTFRDLCIRQPRTATAPWLTLLYCKKLAIVY